MGRRRKPRQIKVPPLYNIFKPAGTPTSQLSEIVLTLGEYEAIRLSDYEGLNHEKASKLMNVSRPTFTRMIESAHQKIGIAFVEGGQLCRALVDSLSFHLTKALKKCEHLLIRYGGHMYAAGLSIAQENVDRFRREFVEVSNRILTDDDVVPKLHIDLEIELTDIDDTFMDNIEAFAPFGPQNMRPVFLTRNCEVSAQPYVVGNNHLKMRIRKGEAQFDVIGFGFGDMAHVISSRGCMVDVVYVVEYNTYHNVTRKQIRLKDIRLTAGTAPV